MATGAGTGSDSALVFGSLQALDASAAAAAVTRRTPRTLRIMTVDPRFDIQTIRRRERRRRHHAETLKGGLERVPRQRVGVFPMSHPVAEPHGSGAVDRPQENLEHGVGSDAFRKDPGVDRALKTRCRIELHFRNEPEALPVAADARHAAIEEHQREVLGMVLAELVVVPEHPADLVERVAERRARVTGPKQQPETFLRQGEEDVVLAREVAVDGRRAVLDALRDFADGDFLVTVADEKVAGCIEDGAGHCLSIAFLSLLESQIVDLLRFTTDFVQ